MSKLKLGIISSSGGGGAIPIPVANWLLAAWIANKGTIYVSDTASTFVKSSNIGTGHSINKVIHVPGTGFWAATNKGRLLNSADGITWTTATLTQNTSKALHSISHSNGSTDFYGSTWTTASGGASPIAGGVPPWYSKIAYGNGVFKVMSQNAGPGYNAIVTNTSVDGFSWSTVAYNTGLISNNNLTNKSFVYGNGVWLAVNDAYSGTTLRSTDGLTWVSYSGLPVTGSINSLAYGNNIFILGTSTGNLRKSTDGITWETMTSAFEASTPATSINNIAYGNGRWTAVGNYALMMSGTDTTGLAWSSRFIFPDTSVHAKSIEYGNGLWVAGGLYGNLSTSTDTVTWTKVKNPISNNRHITNIAYGNGRWFASTMAPSTYTISTVPGGQLITSTDGVKWSELAPPNSNTGIGAQMPMSSIGATAKKQYDAIVSLAYGNGVWVGIMPTQAANNIAYPVSASVTDYTLYTAGGVF